ncbi:MAG: hypothetical protein WA117_19475 [Verrucomicrobiia bacterium]
MHPLNERDVNAILAREMGGRPTLGGMLRISDQLQLDRVALVRRPAADQPAGIAVLLAGGMAMEEIGPALDATAERMGIVSTARIDMDSNSNLSRVFECMDSSGVPWMFARFHYRGGLCVLGLFVGEPCVALAKDLSSLGCPTSLE